MQPCTVRLPTIGPIYLRSIPVNRRTRVEPFGPLSMDSKCIVQGVLVENVDFEIVISLIFGELTKFGGAIKLGVFTTLDDLSFKYAHTLTLRTHFATSAQNERCFYGQTNM